jgi:hypothetical protein
MTGVRAAERTCGSRIEHEHAVSSPTSSSSTSPTLMRLQTPALERTYDSCNAPLRLAPGPSSVLHRLSRPSARAAAVTLALSLPLLPLDALPPTSASAASRPRPFDVQRGFELAAQAFARELGGSGPGTAFRSGGTRPVRSSRAAAQLAGPSAPSVRCRSAARPAVRRVGVLTARTAGAGEAPFQLVLRNDTCPADVQVRHA